MRLKSEINKEDDGKRNGGVFYKILLEFVFTGEIDLSLVRVSSDESGEGGGTEGL